jgi:hypothetical protein
MQVSTALYQYKLYRSLTMVRAATVSLIYVTSLDSLEETLDDSKTVTLMSTDVDRIVSGLELVHETWARLLEMAIGVWLLARQIGAISIAPIVVAIRKLCTVCSSCCTSQYQISDSAAKYVLLGRPGLRVLWVRSSCHGLWPFKAGWERPLRSSEI